MANIPVFGNDTETRAGDQDLITVEGSQSIVKINDVYNDEAAEHPLIAIETTNSNPADGARALVAHGKTDLDGDVDITGDIKVHGGKIDGGDGVVGAILEFGGLIAEKILMSRIGADFGVTIRHWLRVGKDDVANAPGLIDANAGVGAASQDLHIGAGNTTKDIILSRNGQTTRIKGSVAIGNNNDGRIDASGGSYPLKIGTLGTTSEVVMGRSGQTITCDGKLSATARVNLNHNDLVLDDSASAAQGRGFRVDEGNGRLWLYVAGQQSGYFDSMGFHT